MPQIKLEHFQKMSEIHEMLEIKSQHLTWVGPYLAFGLRDDFYQLVVKKAYIHTAKQFNTT